MRTPKKSDVGQLRLESPTSDNQESHLQEKTLRSVPLRDLARYAGRLVRASVQEDAELLVTDRGRPLVVISPVRGTDARPPRYAWSNDGQLSDDPEQEPGVPENGGLPDDLPDDQRAVAELLAERPLCTSEIAGALGWSVGEASLALTRLEIARIVYRKGANWRLTDQ